jgi:hypothetical protein
VMAPARPAQPWQGPGARPRRPASLEDLFATAPAGPPPEGAGRRATAAAYASRAGRQGWTPLVLGGVARCGW